jgi:riboflavin kinase/FMN adenylyltransferase
MLLSQTGVDMCIVLPFTKSIGALSAHDFMHQVLQEQIGAKVLLTGYDNHFGHRSANKQEGFEDYKRYGEKIGMTVRELPQAPCQEGKEIINSSLIRRLLTEGKLEEANVALGRPYSVTGRVVSGEHIGTHLGFPTANLQPDDKAKLIPANGVYAVRASLDGGDERMPAMMNIGVRPTFEGHNKTLEVHILEDVGDIYGRRLTIAFESRLRAERRFDSREALIKQLALDRIKAERVLKDKI